MPKRKRTHEDDGNRAYKRKQDVQETLAQSKKLLHRALKSAKGFERQKLAKRLKVATTNGHSEDIARIKREIEALKGLELGKATDAYLHKTLLKIKAFAESELLPDEARQTPLKPEGSEEVIVAIHNVTSGMCNTKTVKDAMAQILNMMYSAMSLPVPVKQKKEKREETNQITTEPGEDRKLFTQKRIVQESKSSAEQTSESSWNGIRSDGEENDSDQESQDAPESLDEETLARYDALLATSSNEESFDEEAYKSHRHVESSIRLSLSLSPTPSISPTSDAESSASLSNSPEPQPRSSKVKKNKEAPVKVGGSTFLPTLMGGYWSGSEESASDLENDIPKPRKNRPGQAARRAIWEKKYGEKANHIKSGQNQKGNGKGKDDGWDLKRGAKDTSRGRANAKDKGFETRGGGSASGRSRNFEKVTGENALPVQPRGRELGKKDDIGILHPSWQAAKKAKELKKTAKFEGKKVTFD